MANGSKRKHDILLNYLVRKPKILGFQNLPKGSGIEEDLFFEDNRIVSPDIFIPEDFMNTYVEVKSSGCNTNESLRQIWKMFYWHSMCAPEKHARFITVYPESTSNKQSQIFGTLQKREFNPNNLPDNNTCPRRIRLELAERIGLKIARPEKERKQVYVNTRQSFGHMY